MNTNKRNKPKTKAVIESKSTDNEEMPGKYPLNNDQVIENIQYYMSEIRKHRKSLKKEGIL